MKKYLVIGLLASLLLTSCSVDWNDEKEKEIGELEKQVNSISFNKKKECIWYEEKIKEISQINKTEDSHVPDYRYTESLEDIFYSPIKNTCLYSTNITEVMNGETCKFYKIYDYLTLHHDEIENLRTFKTDEKWNLTDECDIYPTSKYIQRVKELKWE